MTTVNRFDWSINESIRLASFLYEQEWSLWFVCSFGDKPKHEDCLDRYRCR